MPAPRLAFLQGRFVLLLLLLAAADFARALACLRAKPSSSRRFIATLRGMNVIPRFSSEPAARLAPLANQFNRLIAIKLSWLAAGCPHTVGFQSVPTMTHAEGTDPLQA
jgi:hypothetical protein